MIWETAGLSLLLLLACCKEPAGGWPGIDARAAVCGNGVVEPPERCDDGNLEDNDGCPADCGKGPELCGDCRWGYGEQCDDGNHYNWDGCTWDCQRAESRVNQSLPGDQEDADVAMAPDGRFVVAWSSGTFWQEKYARVFDSDGSPLTQEILVAKAPTDSYVYWDYRMNVTIGGNGEFSVIMHREARSDPLGYQLVKRDYFASGEPKGEAWSFYTGDNCAVDGPRAAGAADGRHAVTWQCYGDGHAQNRVLLQHFQADGTLDGSPVVVADDTNCSTIEPIQLAMATTGEHLVAWNDYVEVDTGGPPYYRWFQLWARRFSASGEPLGPKIWLDELHPPGDSLGDCGLTDVGLSDAGTFVVTWSQMVTEDDYRCFFSLYDGQDDPIAQRQLCFPDEEVTTDIGSIAMRPDGRFALAWIQEEESTEPDGMVVHPGNYFLWHDPMGRPISLPVALSHFVDYFDFPWGTYSYRMATSADGPLVAVFDITTCSDTDLFPYCLPDSDPGWLVDVFARVFPTPP